MAVQNDMGSGFKTVVSITSVDLVNKQLLAFNKLSGEFVVYLNVMPSGLHMVPKVGEQWLVQKISNSWYLSDKLDYQDPRSHLPQQEGMTALGGQGPTYIVGEPVFLPKSLRMGENGQLQFVDGKLQTRTTDDDEWTDTTAKAKRARFRIQAGQGSRVAAINTVTTVPLYAVSDAELDAFTLNPATGILTCTRTGLYRVTGRVGIVSSAANTALKAHIIANTSIYLAENMCGFGNIVHNEPFVETSEEVRLFEGDTLRLCLTYVTAAGGTNGTISDAAAYRNQLTLTSVV